MPSSFSYSTFKGYLTKEQTFCIVFITTSFYICGFVLLISGLQELYKSSTFLTHQCQVKSIDLKFINRSLHPRWNITAVHENQTINDSLIASKGLTLESEAWNAAEQYKINQTYPCYRSSNQTSFIDWAWQWNKPSKLKAYGFLSTGVPLIVIATILLILRQHYRTELRTTQQQRQLQMSLRIVEQQQTAASAESSPPTYDEAVQWPTRRETRT